jgi:hypothetical protein
MLALVTAICGHARQRMYRLIPCTVKGSAGKDTEADFEYIRVGDSKLSSHKAAARKAGDGDRVGVDIVCSQRSC